MNLTNDNLPNVVRELFNENGDSTWTAVQNIEQETEEGIYQVFNKYTGQHEKCVTLALAKEKYNELKQLIIDDNIKITQLEVNEEQETHYVPTNENLNEINQLKQKLLDSGKIVPGFIVPCEVSNNDN
jgi:CO dehydrogenase nickel-insertion accessory protein CooC1